MSAGDQNSLDGLGPDTTTGINKAYAVPVSNGADVIVLVHGIRDFALWQNSVRATLEEHGFTVEATNYGRFNLIQFLIPIGYFRRLAIETIWRQIRIIRQNNPNAAISIIAHSFGAFVVLHLMEKYFDAKFKRIIICGSVVPYDFELENMQGRFLAPILNEVGTRDIWPAMADSVTFGYGSAGTYGFRRPLVRDRWHNKAHHGYFLDRKFCKRFWVPFLENGTVVPGAENPENPNTWIRLLTIFKLKYFLILAAIVAIAYGASWLKTHPISDYDSPEVPAGRSYCSDIKAVIGFSATEFDAILGGRLGNNRVPTLPLEGWEDCIIFMENSFTNIRRYSCKIPGFPSQVAAGRAGETAARGLVSECLGPDYVVSAGHNVDQIPYWRIVGRVTKAVVKLEPVKDLLSSSWDLDLDLQ